MTLHNKPEFNSPEMHEAMRMHGMEIATPSQLSDAFRLGWIAHMKQKIGGDVTINTSISQETKDALAAVDRHIAFDI